jgi:transposase InsO family protein
MISPTHRRRAVARVRRELPRVSERRACSVIGQPRSTQRHQPKQPEKDRPVVKRMLELVRERPRFGYRRIAKRLRREERFRGINVKRVHRLWRQEGLGVPQKQVKKRRLGSSEGGCVRHRAEHRDHVWCYDFLSDQTEDGRTLKFLPIEDEFTRECLALEVDRRLRSGDVIELLRDLFEVRGAPAYIRSDNGPEFIAGAVRRFLAASDVQTLFIEPGAPWENGYAESFGSRFRDELLDRELFTSVKEAKVVCEDHRLDYNHHRPHSSLGYQTPAEFAVACVAGRSGDAPLAGPAVGAAPLPPAQPAATHTHGTLIQPGT